MADEHTIDDAIEAALAEGLGPGEVMAETAIQQAKRSPTLRRWAKGRDEWRDAMEFWANRAQLAELELTELKQDRENWERIGQS